MISVIVPVYNVQEYLSDCISSIVQQTYPSLEIILVDDGSTDQSGKLCDDRQKQDSRIRVIHKTNGGLSSARNAGIEIAQGDYITFVDSDDIIDKQMYQELVEVLENDQQVDISCCGIERFMDESPEKKETFLQSYNQTFSIPQYIKLVLQHKIDNAVCNKLFRSRIVKSSRFPEGKINEDLLFIFNVLKVAKGVSYQQTSYYKYRIRKGSITQQVHPRLFDFVTNAFTIRDTVLQEMKLPLSAETEGYIYYEMTNYIATVEKYNSHTKHIKERVYCKHYITNHIIRSFSNTSWSIKQKLKFILVTYFPRLYRFLLNI